MKREEGRILYCSKHFLHKVKQTIRGSQNRTQATKPFLLLHKAQEFNLSRTKLVFVLVTMPGRQSHL